MRPLCTLLVLSLALALAAACGDPFGLPRPSASNVIDTVSLYALSGTPPRTPSGYDLSRRATVLVEDGAAFDFAIDLDSAGRPVLKPTGALKLGRSSGVQATTLPFDSIRIAPTGGFQLDSAVTLDVGGSAIVHSNPTGCNIALTAAYYFYAKLQILAVDMATRKIDFQILVDTNCGYRGLDLGLPSR
jgi:hypothetical protein